MTSPSQPTLTADKRRRSGTVGAGPPTELRLLNAFDLRVDGEPVPLPQPAQRVLAFLALSDRRVSRTATAGRLWSDGTDALALGSLRSALWQLRRSGVPPVDASRGQLALDPRVAVDVQSLLSWSHRQLDGVDEAPDLEYVRLFGELLPDWYDDWVILERERLRELHIRALEALSDRLTSAGVYHGAMEAALAAVRNDPLRESAHRCLIRIYLAEGNRPEAVRCYRVFEKLLCEGLGVQPSSLIQTLAGV